MRTRLKLPHGRLFVRLVTIASLVPLLAAAGGGGQTAEPAKTFATWRVEKRGEPAYRMTLPGGFRPVFPAVALGVVQTEFFRDSYGGKIGVGFLGVAEPGLRDWVLKAPVPDVVRRKVVKRQRAVSQGAWRASRPSFRSWSGRVSTGTACP